MMAKTDGPAMGQSGKIGGLLSTMTRDQLMTTSTAKFESTCDNA